MAFSVDQFRQHFAKHGDFAKSSKFQVMIMRSTAPDIGAVKGLSFQCEATELPGFAINTLEAKVYGPSWHIASVPVYTDLTLTFVCASDMWEKKYFDDWMQKIIPTGYATVDEESPHAEYRDNYLSTITIDQYNEYSKNSTLEIPYRVMIFDAFPTSIAPLPLNWGEDGLHRLAVTFKYRKWGRGTANAYQEAAAPPVPNNLDGLNPLEAGTSGLENYTNSGRVS
jgi:hypothetical protein